MYTPILPARTCAEAWVSASSYLVAHRYEGYNLIVDIDDPILHAEADRAVITRVDAFLRAKQANAISTVANTIFPEDLYRRHPEDFVDRYLAAIDSLRDLKWGRYFERLVRWPTGGRESRAVPRANTKKGACVDPLATLIERLKKEVAAKQTHTSFYEITLYDPLDDATRGRGRQCLSFLSFKLHPERGLTLTALYRNHHYVSRALGNFIGLGRLMRYIAREAGVRVGPLTCVSTHAEFEAASREDSSACEPCLGWTRSEARSLIG